MTRPTHGYPAFIALDWTKNGRDWFAIWGKFRADVSGPSGPLNFSHWSVRAGHRLGGSGGTSSVQSSKRSAEIEIVRFAKFLREDVAV